MSTSSIRVGSAVPQRDPTPWSRKFAAPAALVLFACAGLALPLLVASPLLFSLLTQATIGALLATSVGVLIRQSGAVSFGHALFFGFGAYGVAILARHTPLPLELILFAAIGAAGLFAFGLAFAIVRVQGVAFGMLTLAVAQSFYELTVRWRMLANGDDGLALSTPATLFGQPFRTVQAPESMFVICWIVLTLTIVGLAFLARSRFGTLTLAIRDNEERARFIGYETTLPRALVFALSAMLAALAGVLFALYNGFVSPEILHWSYSGAALIMAIIGGSRYVWGPALGAAIYFFFKDAVGDVTDHWPAVIGLTLIVVTVLVPSGLSGGLHHLLQRYRGAQR